MQQHSFTRRTIVILIIAVLLSSALTGFAVYVFASSPTSGPIGQSIDTGYGNTCSASFCIFTNTIGSTQYYYAMAGLNQGSFAVGTIAYGGSNNAGGVSGTDAASVLQNSVNILPNTGGVVRFEAGNYTFNTKVSLKPYVTVKGDYHYIGYQTNPPKFDSSVEIIQSSSNSQGLFYDSGGQIAIMGLKMTGTSGDSGHMIEILNPANTNLEYLSLGKCAYTCMYLHGTSDYTYLNAIRALYSGKGWPTLYLDGISNVFGNNVGEISGSAFGQSGIEIRDSSYVYMTNTWADSNNGSGIEIYGGGTETTYVLNGGEVTNNDREGIYIHSDSNWNTFGVIQNMVIDSNGQNASDIASFGTTVGSGIAIENVRGFRIENNFIWGSPQTFAICGEFANCNSATSTNNLLVLGNNVSGMVDGTFVGLGGLSQIQYNTGFNPQPASPVTAGTSVWTYTNNDGYLELMVLTSVGGISAETCNSATESITVGTTCYLSPGQTMSVTWTTTAPVYEKQPT